MNLTKLAGAAELYEQIRQIDLEISEVNKKAMEIANHERTITLMLKTEDPVHKERVEFDEAKRSSLFRIAALPYIPDIMNGRCNTESNDFAMNLTETETLHVLGALLAVKAERRKQLVNQLNKIKL